MLSNSILHFVFSCFWFGGVKITSIEAANFNFERDGTGEDRKRVCAEQAIA
jgi:hypothetical protein